MNKKKEIIKMFCNKCGEEINGSSKFCPNCGCAVEVNQHRCVEGQDLLEKLYGVRKYIVNSNQKLEKFWDLERMYRREKDQLNVNTVRKSSQYGMSVAWMAVAVIMTITFAVSFRLVEAIMSLAVVGCYWYGRKKNKSVLMKCGAVMQAIVLLDAALFLGDTISRLVNDGNFALAIIRLVPAAIGIIASVIVVKKITRSHNEKIVSENNEIRIHNSEITNKKIAVSNEIKNINNKLVAISKDWYPKDYYTFDAVNHFIKIVENHRADNVREMVAVYEEQRRADKMMNVLSVTKDTVNQLLYKQDELVQGQKQTNVLLMGNLAANIATAKNTGNIVATTAATAANTARIANNMQDINNQLNRF